MIDQKRKIGLLGGSFDPIHFGHLNLAAAIKKKLNLDEIWFVLAKINPLKQNTVPTPFNHRLAMVRLAIEGLDGYSIKELENLRTEASYTIDTLKEFVETNPQYDFYLLLGYDAIKNFEDWKSYMEIIKLCTVVVGTRAGENQEIVFKDKTLCSQILNNIVEIPPLQISSTEIRERLKLNKSCESLLPKAVLDYILIHNLPYLFLP